MMKASVSGRRQDTARDLRHPGYGSLNLRIIISAMIAGSGRGMDGNQATGFFPSPSDTSYLSITAPRPKREAHGTTTRYIPYHAALVIAFRSSSISVGDSLLSLRRSWPRRRVRSSTGISRGRCPPPSREGQTNLAEVSPRSSLYPASACTPIVRFATARDTDESHNFLRGFPLLRRGVRHRSKTAKNVANSRGLTTDADLLVSVGHDELEVERVTERTALDPKPDELNPEGKEHAPSYLETGTSKGQSCSSEDDSSSSRRGSSDNGLSLTGEEIEVPAPSEELYELNMQLAAYAKDAQWEEAIMLLGKMRRQSGSTQRDEEEDNSEDSVVLPEPNVVSYNNVITACANAKKQGRAQRIFRDMTERGVRPNVFTYGALISACAKRGDWRESLKYLEERTGIETPDVKQQKSWLALGSISLHSVSIKSKDMRKAGLAPNAIVYSTVISACERSDQWQRAVNLLRTMRDDGILPVTVTYNTVISACGKSGQWKLALSLLDEMQDMGASPDWLTYANAMVACERSKQWRQVLRLMDHMEEEGMAVDKYAYTTAIHAAAQLGKWARSVRYLEDMGQKGIKRDVVAYSAAISACGEKGQWAHAEKLLRDMVQAGLTPNVITYTSLMAVLRKGRQPGKCIDILQLMQEKGVAPNVRTYSVAISAYADMKEWRQALALLQEMKRGGIAPNTVTYNTAIRACGAAGALTEALQLVNEMEGENVNLTVVTFGSVVFACQLKGEWQLALELLAKMRRYDLEPNEVVYSSVIKTCCVAGEIEKATDLLTRMVELRMRPNTQCFNAVIKALADADQVQNAMRVLSMLRQRKNCVANVKSYVPVVAALCRSLRWQEAILLFEQMEEQSINPTVQCYTSVVRACERSGQYDMALKVLNDMRKRRIRFYDIGILDELFKRLLAAVALLRGTPLPPSLSKVVRSPAREKNAAKGVNRGAKENVKKDDHHKGGQAPYSAPSPSRSDA